ETEQRGAREVVGAWAYRRRDGAELRTGPLLRNGARMESAEDGVSTDLVLKEVRELAEDDLVPALGLRQHSAKIPHHAARHEQAGFLSDELGRHLLQPVDRR